MEPDNLYYNWSEKIIVIADNSEFSHQFTSALLDETNCTQVWIKNGLDLITFCKENNSVNLILMETHLLMFNGIESTKIIKQIKPHIPIIAYTAFDEKDSFIKAGCDAYLYKPVCIDTIYSTINNFLIIN